MADRFDPYLHWLGIRDPERPPNHYRLLGVAPFEDDPDVLTNAADRQMSHVRTFQTGRHSAESQKLLNELATAKVCLLNAAKKGTYDARLRAEQARGASAPPPPVGPRVPPPIEPPAPPPIEPPAPPPIEPPLGPAGDAIPTAGPSGVLLVTPISTSAPRLPKAIAPAPRSSSSVALLLSLLGVVVLLVLGLIHVWRNVDALREKGIDGWGAPADSSGGQDVRDAGRQPRSKPKPPPRARPQPQPTRPPTPQPERTPQARPQAKAAAP